MRFARCSERWIIIPFGEGPMCSNKDRNTNTSRTKGGGTISLALRRTSMEMLIRFPLSHCLSHVKRYWYDKLLSGLHSRLCLVSLTEDGGMELINDLDSTDSLLRLKEDSSSIYDSNTFSAVHVSEMALQGDVEGCPRLS